MLHCCYEVAQAMGPGCLRCGPWVVRAKVALDGVENEDSTGVAIGLMRDLHIVPFIRQRNLHYDAKPGLDGETGILQIRTSRPSTLIAEPALGCVQ